MDLPTITEALHKWTCEKRKVVPCKHTYNLTSQKVKGVLLHHIHKKAHFFFFCSVVAKKRLMGPANLWRQMWFHFQVKNTFTPTSIQCKITWQLENGTTNQFQWYICHLYLVSFGTKRAIRYYFLNSHFPCKKIRKKTRLCVSSFPSHPPQRFVISKKHGHFLNCQAISSPYSIIP